MTAITVGYESHNYGAARNTYAPVDGVSYQKVRRVPFELATLLNRFGFHRAFLPVGRVECDVVHLWNRVSYGSGDWGASFESHFPYVDGSKHPKVMKAMTGRLQRESCRFLVPISEYAKRSMQHTVGEDVWRDVEHKVRVIHPSHEAAVRTSEYRSIGPADPLRLLFVGVTFFGKGGESVLRVIEDVGDELNLHLTVVSPVAGGDYSGIPPESVDVDEIRRRLSSNPRITWKPHLAHDEVLDHIEAHDVGLLPTTADTFGYVVLEHLGLGVPTIVSNVQALPEFTGEDTGWTVELPLDDQYRWLGRRPGIAHRSRAYMDAIAVLQAQIKDILRSIRENPEQLERRGRAARKRFEQQFDPVIRQRRILSLYQEVLR